MDFIIQQKRNQENNGLSIIVKNKHKIFRDSVIEYDWNNPFFGKVISTKYDSKTLKINIDEALIKRQKFINRLCDILIKK